MDASLLVVTTAVPVTDDHPVSMESRSQHEMQWINDDERLEIECIDNQGGQDASSLSWMDMTVSGPSNTKSGTSTSNRLFVAMILAAAVFRIRSI
jgi:hypothetical protein